MNKATSPLATALLVLLPLLAGAADDIDRGDVKKAFRSGNKEKVAEVLSGLEGSLDKKTVKAVIDESKRLRALGVYDQLITTLRTAEGDALEELLKAYKKQRKNGAVRFLVLDAAGGIADPRAEELLVEAASKDKDMPIRVLAIRLLGKRKTKSAVKALIPLLIELEGEDDSERLQREINGALSNLTGEDLTVGEDWQNWWSSHENDFSPKGEDGKTAERGNLLDRMAKDRPAELKTLTRMKGGQLVVVKGNDKVQLALKALDLKYEEVERPELEKMKLDPVNQIVLLNCPGSKSFSEEGIQQIRKFVAEGGYLFCSDWELGKTLAKAFPEACQFLKESPRGDTKDVKIFPFPQGAEHPLMRDVFPLNTFTTAGFAWKLEGRSHLAKMTPGIVPLISCPDIKDQGTTMVAFTFAFTAKQGGRPVTGSAIKKLKRPPGQVLWVSSHFKLQKDPEGDGYALQQLLLNFILEKQNQAKRFN